jgi:hypothetical protein
MKPLDKESSEGENPSGFQSFAPFVEKDACQCICAKEAKEASTRRKPEG